MKNLNSASTSVEDKYKLIYRELQNILQAGLNNESVFDVDCFMIRSNNVSSQWWRWALMTRNIRIIIDN